MLFFQALISSNIRDKRSLRDGVLHGGKQRVFARVRIDDPAVTGVTFQTFKDRIVLDESARIRRFTDIGTAFTGMLLSVKNSTSYDIAKLCSPLRDAFGVILVPFTISRPLSVRFYV